MNIFYSKHIRRNSNSDILCQAFVRLYSEAGGTFKDCDHKAKYKIVASFLNGKKIHYACGKHIQHFYYNYKKKLRYPNTKITLLKEKKKMSYCKEFLKAFRKTVGAKPDEKIDKRYSGWLAPNNKTYGNAHCGYCAEVEYLSEIYDKKDNEEDTNK